MWGLGLPLMSMKGERFILLDENLRVSHLKAEHNESVPKFAPFQWPWEIWEVHIIHPSFHGWSTYPPKHTPPEKRFFFCLLKGNQWLTSPDHKAGYFWGNYQPRSLFTDKFGSNPNTPQLGKGNPKEKMTLEMKIMWYVGFLQIGRFVSCWLLVVCCWLFVVVVVVVVGCWLLVVFCFFFAFRQGISTLYKSSDVRQFLSSSSDPCYIETFQTFLRC